MTQRIDYNDLNQTIIDTLNWSIYRSTNYNINSGLGKEIFKITNDDLGIVTTFKQEYPIISVRFDSKGEAEDTTVSNNNTGKIINITYSITCIYDALEEAEDNLWVMVYNIEKLFSIGSLIRNNAGNYEEIKSYEVNGFKIMYWIVDSVSLKSNIGDDSAYNKSAELSFTIVGYLKDY